MDNEKIKKQAVELVKGYWEDEDYGTFDSMPLAERIQMLCEMVREDQDSALKGLWFEHMEAGWCEEEGFTREHAEILMIHAQKKCWANAFLGGVAILSVVVMALGAMCFITIVLN